MLGHVTEAEMYCGGDLLVGSGALPILRYDVKGVWQREIWDSGVSVIWH